MLHDSHNKENKIKVGKMFLYRMITGELPHLLYGYIIKFLYRNNSEDQGELLKKMQLRFLSDDKDIRQEGKDNYPLTQKSLAQWSLISLLVYPLASSIVMKLIQIRPVK